MSGLLEILKSMSDVEQSEFIRKNYPANERSILMRRKVCGIGVNDADYMVLSNVGGKKIMCKIYQSWKSILMFASKRGMIVCDDWKLFSNFRKWFINSKRDEYVLSFGLVSDSKIYSPESCVFVPKWVIPLGFNSQAGENGVQGASILKNGGYRVTLNLGAGNREHIGFFTSKYKARQAWLIAKKRHISMLKDEIDAIDTRIYPVAMKKLNDQLKN